MRIISGNIGSALKILKTSYFHTGCTSYSFNSSLVSYTKEVKELHLAMDFLSNHPYFYYGGEKMKIEKDLSLPFLTDETGTMIRYKVKIF